MCDIITLEQRVSEIIEPTLDDMGYALVRVQLSGGQRLQLQIMAESKNFAPMVVDDCARISRAVSALLDVEDPIPDAYTLEVSSPGLDRPLTRLADYDRFQGLHAKIEMAVSVDGKKRFKGCIVGADGDEVAVETDEGRIELPFANIAKASLVMTDDLLAAAPEQEFSREIE